MTRAGKESGFLRIPQSHHASKGNYERGPVVGKSDTVARGGHVGKASGHGNLKAARPARHFILALFGGLLGSGIAYLVFNGYTVSTLAGGSFSQTSFAFTVTADIVRQGLILALVVGTFGGILPAWKASRQDITEALRSI